mmetsp:Transcript_20840/g.53199  ORF Transcript_20840/g.53199 Transcript_20840/m.53199 type:complete len:393 (+) Transcript_20840:69-1247(+)
MASEPFAYALSALAERRHAGVEEFYRACGTLRKALLTAATHPDPQYRKLRRSNPRVAELLSMPGIEEAMIGLGFHNDGDALTLLPSVDVHSAVAVLDAAAGSVRRRELVLADRASDPQGWGVGLHSPAVLSFDARFKGAIFDASPRPGAKCGVVAFHNSPFSNFWPCGCGVSFCVRGESFRLATSEGLVMAVKQHLLAPHSSASPGESLASALRTQAALRSGAEAKEAAARATRRVANYQWWSHHGIHVVVGATACLIKFAQDRGLRRLLVSTQGALMIEASPHDGAWGIAMNSSQTLQQSDLPRRFGLHSVAQELVTFEVHGTVYARPSCEANALGKALMIARGALLNSCLDAPLGIELGDAVQLVVKQLRLLAPLPFDWESAVRHLTVGL